MVEELNTPTFGVEGNDSGMPAPQEQPLPAAPRGKKLRISSANLMLAGLFVAGIAGVYLLSLRNGPAKASAQQQQAEKNVESALSQLNRIATSSKSRPGGASELVAGFYMEARERQMPLSSLRCNPFAHKATRPAGKVVLQAAAPQEDQEEIKLLSQAMDAVRSLRLQSVLAGSEGSSTAMISNNVLTEGQRIAGWTVEAIRPTEVLLRWKDQTYVLKLK